MHESRDVRLFLDNLRRGFSASVTRLRVDPDHQRIFLRVGEEEEVGEGERGGVGYNFETHPDVTVFSVAQTGRTELLPPFPRSPCR